MCDRVSLIRKMPKPLKEILRFIRNKLIDKKSSEMAFWRNRLNIDSGVFKNSHYQRLMLGIAQEPDDTFLRGKIVADFGCGPRGSLVWTTSPSLRIGIDVLADKYADEFKDNIISHNMIYLKSTEDVIPLPSNFVDVLFTLNALDHVDSFPNMCSEIIRILKPGGEFIGSFNLDELPTPTEPQKLDEESIHQYLLNKLNVESYRITNQRKDEGYEAFFHGNLSYEKGKPGYLWVRAQKLTL